MRKHITFMIALVMAFTVIAAVPAADEASAADALKKPALTNHAAGKTSIKNTWTKVKGAKGYEVYRAVGSQKKLKLVKTIKDGKTVTWTDKKLKANKVYCYAVRAYKMEDEEKVYGKFSAQVVAIPTNQPNWEYNLSKKTQNTKTLKLTITNKSMYSMRFDPEGIYLKDKAAEKAWADRTSEELSGEEPAQLKEQGITLLEMKKSVTIKPGKKVTLVYRSPASFKYTKTGRIVSQFTSNKIDYGVSHSSKNGDEIWLQ